jgi:hypothetical protein
MEGSMGLEWALVGLVGWAVATITYASHRALVHHNDPNRRLDGTTTSSQILFYFPYDAASPSSSILFNPIRNMHSRQIPFE